MWIPIHMTYYHDWSQTNAPNSHKSTYERCTVRISCLGWGPLCTASIHCTESIMFDTHRLMSGGICLFTHLYILRLFFLNNSYYFLFACLFWFCCLFSLSPHSLSVSAGGVRGFLAAGSTAQLFSISQSVLLYPTSTPWQIISSTVVEVVSTFWNLLRISLQSSFSPSSSEPPPCSLPAYITSTNHFHVIIKRLL